MKPNATHAVCLALALLSPAASAQDATEELLTLPRVRKFVTIGAAADGQVMVCRDIFLKDLARYDRGNCAKVSTKDPFSFIASTRDQVQVLREGFNPLSKLSVVKASSAPDPTNQAVAKVAGSWATSFSSRAGLTDFPLSPTGLDPCRIQNGVVAEAVPCLKALIPRTPPIALRLREWSGRDGGLDSVRGIRAELKEDLDAIEANIKQVDEIRASLLKGLESAEAEPAGSEQQVIAAIALGSDPLARKRALLSNLRDLDVLLKGYDDQNRWVENGLLVDSVATSPEEVLSRRVDLSEVQWDFGDEGLSRKTKEAAPVTLRARAARKLVPEVSAAAVHTRLARPVYSAIAQDGKTVVARGKDEGVDIKPAGLLNFVCRCWGDATVFPMLQVGTTEIDNVPAVLVGGGLRLFGKTPLAISAGGVAAWIRDLNNLKVGDEVKNSLDVDADLKRRLQIKLYVAVQYKF